MRIAVIGTANRGGSVDMTAETWEAMKQHFFDLLSKFKTVELVSGGAPWADHLAVTAFNMGLAGSLKLYLPAVFDGEDMRFVPNPDVKHNPGERLNELHDDFAQRTGVNWGRDIMDALVKGASVQVKPGFHERNSFVAADCEYLVAYTFGDDAKTGGDVSSGELNIPAGGTAFTWDRSRARIKHSVSIEGLAAPKVEEPVITVAAHEHDGEPAFEVEVPLQDFLGVAVKAPGDIVVTGVAGLEKPARRPRKSK